MATADSAAMTSRPARLADVCLFSLGMAIFALCAHRRELVIPRFAGLALAVLFVARTVASAPKPLELFGVSRPSWRGLVGLPLCIGFGIALAVYYRHVQHRPLLPGRLGAFCLVSAGIGICEEVAYRGFVHGGLRRWGVAVACCGAAVAHTGYKLCLFVLPDVAVRAHLVYLGIATLIVGLVLSLMREAFGGLLLPAVAHASFDVVAYGDLTAAPWWV